MQIPAFSLFVAGLLALTPSFLPAGEEHFFDFEADELGRPPQGLKITAEPECVVSVVAGESPNGNPGNQQVLSILDRSGLHWRIVRSFSSASPSAKVSLSVRVAEDPESGVKPQIRFSFNAVKEENGERRWPIVAAVRVNAGVGKKGFFVPLSPKEDRYQPTSISSIDMAAWYRVELTVSAETKKWSYAVTNLNDPAEAARGEFPLTEEASGVVLFNISSEDRGRLVLLDDIKITVP